MTATKTTANTFTLDEWLSAATESNDDSLDTLESTLNTFLSTLDLPRPLQAFGTQVLHRDAANNYRRGVTATLDEQTSATLLLDDSLAAEIAHTQEDASSAGLLSVFSSFLDAVCTAMTATTRPWTDISDGPHPWTLGDDRPAQPSVDGVLIPLVSDRIEAALVLLRTHATPETRTAEPEAATVALPSTHSAPASTHPETQATTAASQQPATATQQSPQEQPPAAHSPERNPMRLRAQPVRTAPAASPAELSAARRQQGIGLLRAVPLDVTVELGRSRLTVHELLALAPGSVVELDHAAGAPADMFVNGQLVARGEVIVIDENFGLRITSIEDRSEAGTP